MMYKGEQGKPMSSIPLRLPLGLVGADFLLLFPPCFFFLFLSLFFPPSFHWLRKPVFIR